jgi:hypothetical protein
MAQSLGRKLGELGRTANATPNQEERLAIGSHIRGQAEWKPNITRLSNDLSNIQPTTVTAMKTNQFVAGLKSHSMIAV